MDTIAQRLNKLDFYTACREADQLYALRKDVLGDSIWKFSDGSILTSHTENNTTQVLK